MSINEGDLRPDSSITRPDSQNNFSSQQTSCIVEDKNYSESLFVTEVLWARFGDLCEMPKVLEKRWWATRNPAEHNGRGGDGKHRVLVWNWQPSLILLIQETLPEQLWGPQQLLQPGGIQGHTGLWMKAAEACALSTTLSGHMSSLRSAPAKTIFPRWWKCLYLCSARVAINHMWLPSPWNTIAKNLHF